MSSAGAASLVAVSLLLSAAAPAQARVREISLRPDPPAVEQDAGGDLQGRARSYYSYCLSQQALLDRDFESAARHMEAALESDPESAELHMELARIYLNLRRADDALGQARRAAAVSPGGVEARRFIVDLFRLELSRNDSPSPRLLEEALAAHQALLDVDPSDSEVRMSMARIHYGRGDYSQAAAILMPHVQTHPDDTDAVFLMARALSRSGRPEKARELLEIAVSAQPDIPELKAALAEAREESGDPAGARKLMIDLVDEFPSRPDYRFALARLHESLGNHAAAAVQAEFLVEQFSGAEAGTRAEADLRAALMFLVETVAASGDTGRAMDIALNAEKRFPDESRFALKRAELLYVESRDDEADALLEELGARRSPPVSSSRLSMTLLRAGAAMEREGRYERAEHLLREAIRRHSGNHAAMNYLGYMLADRGESLDEAEDLIRKALALDGSNGAYLDSLGWTLFKQGRLEAAEGSLLKAAELIPEEAVVHDHLGDLYHAQGRLRDAIRAWESALRLGVDDAARVESKISVAEGEPGER